MVKVLGIGKHMKIRGAKVGSVIERDAMGRSVLEDTIGAHHLLVRWTGLDFGNVDTGAIGEIDASDATLQAVSNR